MLWHRSAFAAMALACGFSYDAMANADEVDPAVVPPRLLQFGDVQNCFMKLSEPSIDGARVGRIEVVAVATIGADGVVVNVEVPELASMQLKSWAKSRVHRWASCVVSGMQFEPGNRDGIPVETSVSIPLKTWAEDVGDRLQPRKTTEAELRSTPEELDSAYRECATAEFAGKQTVLYQFSIDANGRARGIRVFDPGVDRRVNKTGHCVMEKLRFEPHVRDGKFIRQPVHWMVVIPSRRPD